MVYVYNVQTRQQEWADNLDEIQLARLKNGIAEIRTVIEPNNNGVMLPVEVYIDKYLLNRKAYIGKPTKANQFSNQFGGGKNGRR